MRMKHLSTRMKLRWMRMSDVAIKVWIYEGRNSAARLFYNYSDARTQQDIDNGCTPEDMSMDPDLWGNPEISGSEDEGYFYIDDGGSITLTEVEGNPNGNPVPKPVLPPVEFSVGNPVRTTVGWSNQYNDGRQLSGRVRDTTEYGPMSDKRRVQVQFGEPVFWGFDKLWFDPEELELDV